MLRQGRNHKALESYTIGPLFLLMAVGAFARLYGLGEWDYYHDEIWHVYVAKQSTLADVFYTNLTEDGHPILPYFLWHYALKLWDDPWMARLPSLIAGITCIPLSYALGRRWFDGHSGALFSAFFMTFSGLMVEQSNVVRGYALMMCFGLAALWCLYRYRETYSFYYLLAYALALFLAFSCEFAVAPLAVYGGLFGSYIILGKAKPFAHAIGWIGLQLALLAYIAGFVWLLYRIGGVESEHVSTFSVEDYVLWYSYLVLKFFRESGIFTAFFLENSPVDALAKALCLLGCGLLTYRRQWALLILSVTPIVFALVTDYFGMVGGFWVRRNILVVLSTLIFLYTALAFVANQITALRHLSFSKALIGAIISMTLLYLVYGTQWRHERWYEFQQTRAQTQDIFSYLEQQVQPGDIILTEWSSSYYYFWQYHKACATRMAAQDIGYYPCYKVPVYLVPAHQRNYAISMTLHDLQTSLQRLQRAGMLASMKRVWIVGIQHIDIKTRSLNPGFAIQIKELLLNRGDSSYKNEVNALIKQQHDFLVMALKQPAQKLVDNEQCDFKDPGAPANMKCKISFAAIPFSRSFVYEQFIDHTPYINLKALIMKSHRLPKQGT